MDQLKGTSVWPYLHYIPTNIRISSGNYMHTCNVIQSQTLKHLCVSDSNATHSLILSKNLTHTLYVDVSNFRFSCLSLSVSLALFLRYKWQRHIHPQRAENQTETIWKLNYHLPLPENTQKNTKKSSIDQNNYLLHQHFEEKNMMKIQMIKMNMTM